MVCYFVCVPGCCVDGVCVWSFVQLIHVAAIVIYVYAPNRLLNFRWFAAFSISAGKPYSFISGFTRKYASHMYTVLSIQSVSTRNTLLLYDIFLCDVDKVLSLIMCVVYQYFVA